MSHTHFSLRELTTYIGPGFLISVAYMDPGNWATNISGGAQFGTALLWVIVLASFMAMGIQIVAAKLGIATGKGVVQLCRERFSRPGVLLLWVAAELALIATATRPSRELTTENLGVTTDSVVDRYRLSPYRWDACCSNRSTMSLVVATGTASWSS